MKKRVDVRDLRLGMYVAELDRPWLETPFLRNALSLTWSTIALGLAVNCALSGYCHPALSVSIQWIILPNFKAGGMSC